MNTTANDAGFTLARVYRLSFDNTTKIKEMYLLQFYYDNESNDIIGFRIVEFDSIEESFKSKLDRAGGVIRVEKGR